jgi:hypothetical protein
MEKWYARTGATVMETEFVGRVVVGNYGQRDVRAILASAKFLNDHSHSINNFKQELLQESIGQHREENYISTTRTTGNAEVSTIITDKPSLWFQIRPEALWGNSFGPFQGRLRSHLRLHKRHNAVKYSKNKDEPSPML